MNLVLSPHNDDAVLFATFTILRDKSHVFTVLDSYVQPSRGYQDCDHVTRRLEDEKAIGRILSARLTFMGYRDDHPEWDSIEHDLRMLARDPAWTTVFAPTPEIGGHDHHNRLGEIAARVFPDTIRHYMTYTNRGKSRGTGVAYQPEWILKKLQALGCYKSQIALPNCVDHFLREQYEYYER